MNVVFVLYNLDNVHTMSGMWNPDCFVMVHLDVVHDAFSDTTLYMDVKPCDVHVELGKKFTNKLKFVIRDHMLQWVRMEAAKLGFNIVIRRSNFGSNKRPTFVTIRCEKSDKFITPT